MKIDPKELKKLIYMSDHDIKGFAKKMGITPNALYLIIAKGAMAERNFYRFSQALPMHPDELAKRIVLEE